MKPTKLKSLTKQDFEQYNDETNPVTWIVTGEVYERMGDSELFTHLYEKVSPRELTLHLLQKHGYGYDEDEDLSTVPTSELIQSLNESNGDGCDAITIIDLNNKTIVISI